MWRMFQQCFFNNYLLYGATFAFWGKFLLFLVFICTVLCYLRFDKRMTYDNKYNCKGVGACP